MAPSDTIRPLGITAATALALTVGFTAPAAADDIEVPDIDPDIAEEAETRNGPPGDNGTVKVHDPDTPDDDNRNEPHVCDFTLVGSNFDGEQDIWWKIKSWPPTGDRSVVDSGTLTLDEDGYGSTEELSLDDGHYKLFWNFDGQKGKAKQKVFWVDCEEDDEADEDKPPADKDDDKDDDHEDEGKDSGEDKDPDAPEDGEDPPAKDDEDAPEGDEDEKDAPAEEADGGLPVTGAALAGLIAAGMAALGGGGGALLWARKRRNGQADTPAEDA